MIPKSVAANRAVSMTVSMHTTVHCDSKGGTSGLSAFRAVVFGLGLSPKSEAVRKFYTCRKYSTIDNKQCVIVCASGSCVHVCMMYGAPPSHGQHQGELGQAARDDTARPSHEPKLRLACQNIHSRLSPPKYCTACHADCRFNAAYTPALRRVSVCAVSGRLGT